MSPPKRFSPFLILISALCLWAPQSAQAHGSWWDFIVPPPVPDFTHPYLNEGKIPHNNQWDSDTWTPQGWIEGAGSAEFMMQDLYKSGIVTDQYESGGVPVLEVGRTFRNLSEQDKRHVAMFVDYVFNITQSSPEGMFYIYDEKTDEPIGLYTAEGLQLQ